MTVIQLVSQMNFGLTRGGFLHLAEPHQQHALPVLLPLCPLHNRHDFISTP